MSISVCYQSTGGSDLPVRRARRWVPGERVSINEEDLENPAALDALWALIYKGSALVMLYIKKPTGISSIGYIRVIQERLIAAGAGNLVHHLIIYPIR